MTRFVILEHDWPFLHWDLLVDVNGVDELATWRLLNEPLSADTIDAEPLPPHRRRYLDYTGPISGDRGSVTRWDAGECEVLSDSVSRPWAPEFPLTLHLKGEKIQGAFRIEPHRSGCRLRRLKQGEGC